MVVQFLNGVGDILVALFKQMDAVFAMYISGAVVSSFFALWLLKRVLIFFDIIKG